MNVQRYVDDVVEKTLLPFIPYAITPNMVSWARIASLPFIFYFLYAEHYVVGLTVFIIAALTDALDGAMARKRDRETETGKILDAVADRSLIALVALIFLPRFFGWWLVIAIGALELLNAAAAYRSRRRLGYNPGANWAGKVKMFLQCIAFGMLFIALFAAPDPWLTLAYWLLLASLMFAFLQSFVYPVDPLQSSRVGYRSRIRTLHQ